MVIIKSTSMRYNQDLDTFKLASALAKTVTAYAEAFPAQFSELYNAMDLCDNVQLDMDLSLIRATRKKKEDRVW
jgi:hypothetical protein